MRRKSATHTCFACGECIEGEEPEVHINQRTGNKWHSHRKDECRNQPTPDSYAATARFMSSLGDNDDEGMDWDRWKDEMKDAE